MEKITRMVDFSLRENDKENESRRVLGQACVFNQKTDLGWFTEEIDNRAFDGCDMSDVVLNLNHDDTLLLAGTRNGSLKLEISDFALNTDAEIIDTSTGNDVVKLMRAGLINKMSFAFTVDWNDPEAIEWIENKNEVSHRIVRKIKKLYDVSLVTFPAYEQTSAFLRSADCEDNNAKEHKEMLERRNAQDRKMRELFNE